ncbi:MAG: tRNA (guanosine(46)-N7)-methyltransferase TrmB [Pseudomonadota bacterium]
MPNDAPSPDQPRYIPKLYGRRQDKPLKPRQARLMDELLPRVAIHVPETGKIDLDAIFPGADVTSTKRVQLELGFGGGEHLAWQAANAPDVGFIGAEPFVNGVAKLLSEIDERGLTNVRVLHGDGRPLMEALPDQSLERIYVLHPDPWPKTRHHKRRIISPWFFKEAARLVIPGGTLRIASDIPDYIRWTLMHAQGAPAFTWTAERASDWHVRPDDWPQTRYEAKSLREGRQPAYLIYERG